MKIKHRTMTNEPNFITVTFLPNVMEMIFIYTNLKLGREINDIGIWRIKYKEKCKTT